MWWLANTWMPVKPEFTGVPGLSPPGALGCSRLLVTVFGGAASFGAGLADVLATPRLEEPPHALIASAHNSAIAIETGVGIGRRDSTTAFSRPEPRRTRTR